ncbi:DUF3289 family protein [Streptomyces sp. HMX87]|uniref:DUF3289 family protein n=1 Tax=Streptomyces sp. HMX87 TaxID=3390849 RepID=UPI003A8B1A90
MPAAERFALGEPSSVIAKDLRVSVRSVQRWRRAWQAGGPRALRSAGSPSPPRLSEEPFAVSERESAKGPVAYGRPGQRWTLARTKTLIGRRFHKSYTPPGVRKLLIRHGFSCQIPARRAVERDEEVEGNSFSGKLVFHSYDHFGLDPDDEIKEYGFIDWFTLQHYDRFDGKYPPPIAHADIEIPVSGTF